MIYEQPYEGIQNTMDWFKVQMLDGWDYAQNNVPLFTSPRQLWNWLKLRTTFVHDPANEELLQSLPTLLENNWHGIPGAGDCDCFALAAATIMAEQGIPNSIMLVGKRKSHPVHIYNVVYWDGQRYILDFANPYFNQERTQYKYFQEIPVGI